MADFTTTQDVWNRNAVEVRHINPSIMEGERGHTSMFGHRSAVVIVRYPPTFLNQATISGSVLIPSTLTCNPGVVEASPQAQIFYQWRANGVDIPGATNKTFVTTLDYNSVPLTCYVTAVNPVGVDYSESNTIIPELIEPIVNAESTYLIVSGLNQVDQMNIMRADILIATGISQKVRTDMTQHIILVGSGMWVETRVDINSCTVALIEGSGGGSGLHGYTQEAYTIWQPTFVANLPLVNASAQLGNITGWTVTEGGVSAVQTPSAPGSKTIIHSSDPWFFKPADPVVGSFSDSRMEQVITLDAGYLSEIDQGVFMYDFRFYMDNAFAYDTVTGTITFLDLADGILGGESIGPVNNVFNDPWKLSMTSLNYIPSGTRKIRVGFTFHNHPTQQTSFNYGYVDDILVRLFKDI